MVTHPTHNWPSVAARIKESGITPVDSDKDVEDDGTVIKQIFFDVVLFFSGKDPMDEKHWIAWRPVTVSEVIASRNVRKTSSAMRHAFKQAISNRKG